MEIAVLCGGDSPERAVSLRSGARVCEALCSAGHAVSVFDPARGLDEGTLAALRGADAVFLALHGGDGEGGGLQAALEAAGIRHYTGTGPEGAALAMDKARARYEVSRRGVPVADGLLLSPDLPPELLRALRPPLVLKPNGGGSSVGLRFLHDARALAALRLSGPMLCERFLPGREFTVGLLLDEVLPVVEIRPRGGAYDYAHKYTPGASEELCPAPIPPRARDLLVFLARRAFEALGLRDYARIDFREDETGLPHFLEANTLPGMTGESLFPLAAAAAGISYAALCERMAAAARSRKGGAAGKSGT